MATKPGSSFTLATNANYSVGERVGSPTKIAPPDAANGFIPGEGVTAEDLNYCLAILGDWSVWLLAGSALAGQDRHLVETDAAGQTAIAGLVLGGTSAGFFPLAVIANTGAPSAAATFANNGAGFAIQASAGGASAAVRATATGSGAGVEAQVVGGTGPAVKATRPAAAGPALSAEKSGSGAPARGSVYLEPEEIADQPTTTTDGDVWKIRRGGSVRGALQYYDDDGGPGGAGGGVQSVWSTSGGHGHAWFQEDTPQDNDTTTYAIALTGVINAGDSPGQPAGEYIVSVYAEVEAREAGAEIGLFLREDAGGTSIAGVVHETFADVGNFNEKAVTLRAKVTLGAGGPQAYSLMFRADINGLEVRVSRSNMRFEGAYEV